MNTNLYFAYGANMHPGHMQFRCPAAQAVGAFTLKNGNLNFTVMPQLNLILGPVLQESCGKLLMIVN